MVEKDVVMSDVNMIPGILEKYRADIIFKYLYFDLSFIVVQLSNKFQISKYRHWNHHDILDILVRTQSNTIVQSLISSLCLKYICKTREPQCDSVFILIHFTHPTFSFILPRSVYEFSCFNFCFKFHYLILSRQLGWKWLQFIIPRDISHICIRSVHSQVYFAQFVWLLFGCIGASFWILVIRYFKKICFNNFWFDFIINKYFAVDSRCGKFSILCFVLWRTWLWLHTIWTRHPNLLCGIK